MDSSKIEGAGEWSSSESGWTAYIASPDHKDDDDKEEEEEEEDEDRSINKRGKDKQEVDSDDSMASDASSVPSDGYGAANRHHAESKNERKHYGKQQMKKQLCDREKKIKAAKDKPDSPARSKQR